QAPAEGAADPVGAVAADGAVVQRQQAAGAEGDAAAEIGRVVGDDHAAQGQRLVGHVDGPAPEARAGVAPGQGQAADGDVDGPGRTVIDLEDPPGVVAVEGDDPRARAGDGHRALYGQLPGQRDGAGQAGLEAD